MSAELVAQIRADYDRLLGGCEELYRSIESKDIPQAPDGSADDRLVRVTELIEILESVTFDRIRRLRS